MKTELSFALTGKEQNAAQEWLDVTCERCGAVPGAPCVSLSDPATYYPGRSSGPPPGQPTKAPHPVRVKQGSVPGRRRRFAEWLDSPAGRDAAAAEAAAAGAAVALAEAMRAHWAAAARVSREANEARYAQQVARDKAEAKRDAKREAGGYNWEESDDRGKKRQRLVQWLMMSPRCVSLDRAKLIAWKKYR